MADAVYKGTKEVAAPMIASTFTSVAVFLPLIFVVGIAGQLFRRPGAHHHLRPSGFAGGGLHSHADGPGAAGAAKTLDRRARKSG